MRGPGADIHSAYGYVVCVFVPLFVEVGGAGCYGHYQ